MMWARGGILALKECMLFGRFRGLVTIVKQKNKHASFQSCPVSVTKQTACDQDYLQIREGLSSRWPVKWGLKEKGVSHSKSKMIIPSRRKSKCKGTRREGQKGGQHQGDNHALPWADVMAEPCPLHVNFSCAQYGTELVHDSNFLSESYLFCLRGPCLGFKYKPTSKQICSWTWVCLERRYKPSSLLKALVLLAVSGWPLGRNESGTQWVWRKMKGHFQ